MSLGFIFLIAAGCLWGAIGPISRLAFAAGVTPLETAFWRGTIAGSAYWAHFFISRRYPGKFKKLPDDPRAWRLSMVLATIGFGILGVGLLEGSYVYAVKLGGASLASILLYSAPIWVNLVGRFFLKEYISPKQWLALSITFVGIAGVSILGSKVEFSPPAIICGLLAGVGYALFYIAGKYFFKTSHPVSVFMIAFPIGSLSLLPLIYLLDGISVPELIMRMAHFPLYAQFAIFGIGLLSTYLPYLLYAAGLKHVDTGRAAIVTTIEPVVSITLASLMWGERFSPIGYVFCVLVLIGIAMVR